MLSKKKIRFWITVVGVSLLPVSGFAGWLGAAGIELTQAEKHLQALRTTIDSSDKATLSPKKRRAALNNIKKLATAIKRGNRVLKALEAESKSPQRPKTASQHEDEPQPLAQSALTSPSWNKADIEQLILGFDMEITDDNKVKVTGQIPTNCQKDLEFKWVNSGFKDESCSDTRVALTVTDHHDQLSRACISDLQKAKHKRGQSYQVASFPRGTFGSIDLKAPPFQLPQKGGRVQLAHTNANGKLICENPGEGELRFITQEERAKEEADQQRQEANHRIARGNAHIEGLLQQFHACRNTSGIEHAVSALDQLRQIHGALNREDSKRMQTQLEQSQLEQWKRSIRSAATPEAAKSDREELIKWANDPSHRGYREDVAKFVLDLARNLCNSSSANGHTCMPAITMIHEDVFEGLGEPYKSRPTFTHAVMEMKVTHLALEAKHGVPDPDMMKRRAEILNQELSGLIQGCGGWASGTKQECAGLAQQRQVLEKAVQLSIRNSMALQAVQHGGTHSQMNPMGPGMGMHGMMGGMDMYPQHHSMIGAMGLGFAGGMLGMGMNPYMNMNGFGMNPYMNINGMNGFGMNPYMNMNGMNGFGMNPYMNMNGMNGFGMNPYMNMNGMGMPGAMGAPRFF